MFPRARDQGRSSAGWRAAVQRAAGRVIALATLDSYGLPSLPHEEPWREQHPHRHQRRPLPPNPRRRGHGVPPVAPAVCVSTTAVRRPGARAADRVRHLA